MIYLRLCIPQAVISAPVVGIAATRFSALFAKPPQNCDAASAFGYEALVDEAEPIGTSALALTVQVLMLHLA